MEKVTLSPEAKEARNAYQRGYMKKYRKENPNHINEFWERKAQKLNESQVSTTTDQSIEDRIRANERLIKNLLSENKRLIKELEKVNNELKKLKGR